MTCEVAQLAANYAQVLLGGAGVVALFLTVKQLKLQGEANQALAAQLRDHQSRQRIESFKKELLAIGNAYGSLQTRLQDGCKRKLGKLTRQEVAEALQEVVLSRQIDLDRMQLESWVRGILEDGRPG